LELIPVRLLTGKFTGKGADSESRRTNFDFPPINEEKAYDLADFMGEIAKEQEASIAQIALAWVREQLGVTSTSIGGKTLVQSNSSTASIEIQSTLGVAR
jgi:aryl-alcohol dehydrogenase-like predicted oxidoreductase